MTSWQAEEYTATYALNPYLNQWVRYDTPTHFSGYTKVQMGMFAPYTVGYGRNETSLRLYRSEEVDCLNSANRIKVIKVPLTPPGDKIGMQLVGYNNTATNKYFGDDFLILEWRSNAPFSEIRSTSTSLSPAKAWSFIACSTGDRALRTPVTIMAITSRNNIAIQDATPPLPPYASLNDYTLVRQVRFQRRPRHLDHLGVSLPRL